MNRVISGLRYKVERAIGTLKKGYGFDSTRDIGYAKVKLYFMLCAMAFNLKKAECAHRAKTARLWAETVRRGQRE